MLVILFAGLPGEERVLSVAELNAMDRENAMWRVASVDHEVSEVIGQWRATGFNEAEVNALHTRLTELWTVTAERNFGWLHEDTVEQVKSVDREFIPRMRAVRLYQATGIRSTRYPPASVSGLNRMWRQAILRVLAYDEIAEFMLMNSPSARESARLAEGLKLSMAEQRLLFGWQREFDLANAGASLGGLAVRRFDWREARLDHWDRVRELLGDDRFVVFLSRAEQEFDDMRAELARIGAGETTMALDLWWVRQKHEISRGRVPLSTDRTLRQRDAEVQASALAVLGEEQFQLYARSDHARWLFSSRVRPGATVVKAVR
jgi:hypothetical protein